MGPERLQRKFLTSWVRHPRPHGRPQFTFGHSLNKTLKKCFVSSILDKDDFAMLNRNEPLKKGLNIINGDIVYKAVADAFNLNYTELNI